MKKNSMIGMFFAVSIVSIVLLKVFLSSVAPAWENESAKQPEITAVGLDKEEGSEDYVQDKNESAGQKETESETESEEEKRRRHREILEGIDFTPRPLLEPSELYTPQMDMVFKKAFLKVLNNEIVMGYGGRVTYFRDTLRGEDLYGEDAISNEKFSEIIKKLDYYYYDYDRDGYPELTVLWKFDGSSVLKYDIDKDSVSLCGGGADGWHLLGSGQSYYCHAGGANRIYWEYVDSWEDESIILHEVYDLDENDNWQGTYIIGPLEVNEDIWNEVTKDFFEAIEHEVEPLSFDEIFGDID